MMYAPELKVKFLSVLALEDMGYTMLFMDRHVILCEKGAALDTTMRLGINQGMMYMLLEHPVGGSIGNLDQRSMYETVSWYEMTRVHEKNIASD